MNYKIQIDSKAFKALKKFPKKDQQKIKEVVDSLKDDPRPMGYRKLKGNKNPVRYRIRIGDYRVIYQIKDKQLIVLVVDMGDRKDIYG